MGKMRKQGSTTADSWEQRILDYHGLSDWIVENAKDGYCWYSQKRIQRTPGDRALFLHEVAHALCYKQGWPGEGFHGGLWADKFTELVGLWLSERGYLLEIWEAIKEFVFEHSHHGNPPTLKESLERGAQKVWPVQTFYDDDRDCMIDLQIERVKAGGRPEGRDIHYIVVARERKLDE